MNGFAGSSEEDMIGQFATEPCCTQHKTRPCVKNNTVLALSQHATHTRARYDYMIRVGSSSTHCDPQVRVRVVVAVDDPPGVANGGRHAAVERRQIGHDGAAVRAEGVLQLGPRRVQAWRSRWRRRRSTVDCQLSCGVVHGDAISTRPRWADLGTRNGLAGGLILAPCKRAWHRSARRAACSQCQNSPSTLGPAKTGTS